jgi:hypothetical protein
LQEQTYFINQGLKKDRNSEVREKNDPTEENEESDSNKRKKVLLNRLQNRLERRQAVQKTRAPKGEESEDEEGNPEEGKPDGETGDSRGNPVDRLAGQYRMDLWGDGRQRTQTRVSDLSLKYL